MVISYKYIYTETLLCRSSWGSVLQFRTPCFLDPPAYPGLPGPGIMAPIVRLQHGGRRHLHIHCPYSCHRPHPYRITSLPPGCCLLELRVLLVVILV